MKKGRLERCKKEHCEGSRHGELFIPCHQIKRVSQTYIISDTPKPLARPRFKENKVYDSQKQYKFVHGLELARQHKDQEPYDGVLHFDIDFYFRLPKAKSAKLQRQLQQYHTAVPDLDNLIKMCTDLCVDVGILKDDSIISSIFSRKLYDEGEPRTEFVITQIKTPGDEEY